jgi:prolyl-tRNA synthetase
LTVVVDKSLEGRKNMVCGANKLDYHLRNVTPGRDFTWTLAADIRSVNEGEACPKDGCAGKLVVGKAVEIGHIFKLGYKYSEHGRARAGRERQGSDADHGQLRHRHRAHSDGGHRAVERQERLLAAGLDCALHGGGHGDNMRDALLAETGEKLAAELEAAGPRRAAG